MRAHNFEISSALITVIILGKLLEVTSKKKTMEELSGLAELKSMCATVVPRAELGSGLEGENVPIELVQIGDFVRVLPGQTVPVDGVVACGTGLCNESMLTGEAKPISKEIGVKIYGGSLLTVGSLIVQAERLSEDSTLN